MTNRRSIPLPDGFPMPRYHFGQVVEWRWCNDGKTYHEMGTIDGMMLDYSDNPDQPSWVYMVNLNHESDSYDQTDVIGMSVSEAEIVAYSLESLIMI